MAMKSIMVPCDFSGPARNAFTFAVELAGISNGEVHVIHFVELPVVVDSTMGMGPYPIDPKVFSEMEEQALEEFEKMKNAATLPAGVNVKFKSVRGYIIQGIQGYVKANNIDLIVMGTHGAKGMEEFFVGSHTEKIVRLSPVPVLAIRNKISVSSVGNIVLPNGLEAGQEQFIEKVKALQKFFQATLHILLVNTPNHFRREQEANAALEEFARNYKLERYTLNFRSHTLEQEGILAFAKEVKADIIAMGTHGRKGLAHLFKGSIAESVVNHVETPIWTCNLG